MRVWKLRVDMIVQRLLSIDFYFRKGGFIMKKILSLALAAAFVAGVQGMALASTPQMVMLDEEVILEVDEPVESGDILVDEDGDVWEVQ